jgi:hypothetical protein
MTNFKTIQVVSAVENYNPQPNKPAFRNEWFKNITQIKGKS